MIHLRQTGSPEAVSRADHIMSGKTVFISYRRDAVGRSFARSIKQELTHCGYDVFLDVDCVDAGQWAAQIITQVPQRAHFLLLLTPDALDRCADEADWVRREFLSAVRHGRNIVPVREESVDPDIMRTTCVAEMKSLFDLQIAVVEHRSFNADIDALTTRFIAAHHALHDSLEPASRPVDISRIIKYAPEELIGRDAETKLLNDAWNQACGG